MEFFSCSAKRWASESISAWSSTGSGDSADSRVPGILRLPIRIDDLLPSLFRNLSLDVGDELLDVFGGPQFRVHAGEQNDVHPEFGALGRLCLHPPVGAKEHYDVESD